LEFFPAKDSKQVAQSVNGVFKETVGRRVVFPFEEMEVILNDFIVEFKQVTVEMQSHMSQTSGIVGGGTLAFTGNGYRSAEPFEL